MILSILYIFGISISAGTMMFIISRSQYIISEFVQNNTCFQPYAFSYVKRENILILVLMEAPVIISAICIALINSFIKLQIDYIWLIILSYLISILIVSIATIFYSSNQIGQFFNFVFAHPQYATVGSSRFILLFSLFQAPMIINIISIIINIFQLRYLFEITEIEFYFEKILISSAMIIGSCIASIGSIKGISFVIEAFFKSSTYYHSKLDKIFINLFVFIGLIDAPFIFTFILNLFMQRILLLIIKNYIFLSFLIIIFSIIAYFVSLYSGKTASKALSLLTNDSSKNRSILSVSFIAQVLLDTRILYMFILFILCLLKMELLK